MIKANCAKILILVGLYQGNLNIRQIFGSVPNFPSLNIKKLKSNQMDINQKFFHKLTLC